MYPKSKIGKPGRYVLQRAGGAQKADRRWRKTVAQAGWDDNSLKAAVAMDVAAEHAVANALSAPRSRAQNAEELKGIDVTIPLGDSFPSTTNTNGKGYLLNGIQAGSGPFNRIGRKVTMKSLRIHMHFTSYRGTVGGVLPGNAARLVVVYDRQPSGGPIPTFDTIFAQTSQAGATTTTMFDNLRLDNTERFRVLRDHRVTTTHNGYPSADDFGGYDHFLWDEFIPLNGMETVYQSNTAPATITDISTGAIYLFIRGEKDAMSSKWAVDVGSYARLRYYG